MIRPYGNPAGEARWLKDAIRGAICYCRTSAPEKRAWALRSIRKMREDRREQLRLAILALRA